ncbi:MAG: hypothetical protein CVV30_09795 [Methanomicrobiales archaeon HGW-Methanomicrobiales-1]|nr:MAG: hypothetical protein CVV30_09795 [Methanomicrobiales archaeon HGW-Methanomicrobiales-1]
MRGWVWLNNELAGIFRRLSGQDGVFQAIFRQGAFRKNGNWQVLGFRAFGTGCSHGPANRPTGIRTSLQTARYWHVLLSLKTVDLPIRVVL